MNKIEELSLKELKDLEEFCPILGNFPSRILADKYNDFLDVLYKDITNIVNEFQLNSQYYQLDSGKFLDT